LCPHEPRRGDLQTARHLADQLVAVDPNDPWSVLLQAQVDDALGAAALARSKRQLVAERWRNADSNLPLVQRLRESVGETDEPRPEPESEAEPEPPEPRENKAAPNPEPDNPEPDNPEPDNPEPDNPEPPERPAPADDQDGKDELAEGPAAPAEQAG
jgi:hypothetical protein